MTPSDPNRPPADVGSKRTATVQNPPGASTVPAQVSLTFAKTNPETSVASVPVGSLTSQPQRALPGQLGAVDGARHVEPVDVGVVGTLLLDDEDLVAQAEQVMELPRGEVAVVETEPGEHE